MSERRDGAAEFHAMYLAICEDCKRTGIPAPTPEEWVGLIEEKCAEPPQPDPDQAFERAGFQVMPMRKKPTP